MTSVLFAVTAVVLAVAVAARSTWSPCGLSMLASITPLAERGRGHRYRATATWFVVGGAAGGATLGLAIAGLAAGVHAMGTSTGRFGVALGGCLLAVAADAGLGGFRLPVHRRQVNERWLDQFRPWVYGAGFGWQIGTGLATYVMTPALYLVILLVSSGAPLVAFGVALLFGLLRGLAVLLGRGITDAASLTRFHRRFHEAEPRVRGVLVAVECAALVAFAWRFHHGPASRWRQWQGSSRPGASGSVPRPDKPVPPSPAWHDRYHRPIEPDRAAPEEHEHPLPIRLMLADVDGTLVTQEKILTDRAIAAVRHLRDAGVLFAVTSGRPPKGMEMLIEPLDLQTPIAAFNGGLIVDRSLAVLEQRVLPEDIVVPLSDLMSSFGLVVWVYRGADWYVPDPDGPHVHREAWTVKFQPKVMQGLDGLTDGVAKLVGVSDDHDAVASAAIAARTQFGARVTAAASQPYYLDVTHPNANKGFVAQYLAQRYQLVPEQVATIGDQPNDVLMFAHSALSIAMGNADPGVKRAARCVTATNEKEGFALAVEHFVLPADEAPAPG